MHHNKIGLEVLLAQIVVRERCTGKNIGGTHNDGLARQEGFLNCDFKISCVFALADETNSVDGRRLIAKLRHASEAGSCQSQGRSSLSEVHGKVGPVSVPESSETEETQSLELIGVHCFALEYESSEAAVVLEVLEAVHEHHLFGEITISLIKPLKILTLNSKGECLVLINRSVLNLKELVELSFENIEIATFECVQVNVHLLVLFQGVNDLVELWLTQEKLIVSQSHSPLNLINRHAQSILIKIFLQRFVRVLFEPVRD